MLILGGILAVAWIGLLLLRVPSSIAFLSLLIGQLLSSETGGDVYDFVGSLLHVSDLRYVQMALLLLPLILTILFLRNHVPKAKLMIEALPILFVVALTILLLAPLLEPQDNLVNSATNDQVGTYKTVIVIAASISGLLSAWISYPKAHKEGKHGKH